MSALFIILVGLTMTGFSEKMLVSTRCIHGFMSNLIKKSWTDSTYGPATALILTHKIPLIKIQARKICHWIFLNKLLFVETILYFTYKADGRSENLGGGEGKL